MFCRFANVKNKRSMRTEIIEILQKKYPEYCMQHIDTADEILRLFSVVGQSEQLCPKCSSNDLFDIDDHYTKCKDCGFTFVGV